MNSAAIAWLVMQKELRDAFRDRRTLLVVFISAVCIGPLFLFALSLQFADVEHQREQRHVLALGADHAPTLVNYLQRQAWSVGVAPEHYETLLRDSKLSEPVLLIPDNFESALEQGDQPELILVSDSNNRKSQTAAQSVAETLRGFVRERAGLGLAVRGVSARLLAPIKLQEHDLADRQTRGAQITSILSFLVLMGMLSGTLNAALDSTAGERERGSLEPLLVNPVSTMALTVGKWGAVALVGMVVAVCSCLSFLPGQWLLRSESLQAMFKFGLPEIVGFLSALLPLACALAAVLMAVAIRSKTVKEAQANTSVVLMLCSMVPLVSALNDSGDQAWHWWVPVLAQNQVMIHVVKGESISWQQTLIPAAVSAILTLLALRFVAAHLRSAALK